jgi:hypothetical protein
VSFGTRFVSKFLSSGIQHSVVLWKSTDISKKSYHLLHADFWLGVFFDPEDRSDMFLWNVSWLSTEYAALDPRRQNSQSSLWEPQILHRFVSCCVQHSKMMSVRRVFHVDWSWFCEKNSNKNHLRTLTQRIETKNETVIFKEPVFLPDVTAISSPKCKSLFWQYWL